MSRWNMRAAVGLIAALSGCAKSGGEANESEAARSTEGGEATVQRTAEEPLAEQTEADEATDPRAAKAAKGEGPTDSSGDSGEATAGSYPPPMNGEPGTGTTGVGSTGVNPETISAPPPPRAEAYMIDTPATGIQEE